MQLKGTFGPTDNNAATLYLSSIHTLVSHAVMRG
jgi:hypothetical protein